MVVPCPGRIGCPATGSLPGGSWFLPPPCAFIQTQVPQPVDPGHVSGKTTPVMGRHHLVNFFFLQYDLLWRLDDVR